MPAWSPPVPARSLPVPARCRLGSRRWFPPVPAGTGSVTVGAGSIPARSLPVPSRSPPVLARCRLGPRLCRLGHFQCRLGHRWCRPAGGSRRCRLTACAGPVPARFPPLVPAGAGLVPAGPGSVPADAVSVPAGAGSVPARSTPVTDSRCRLDAGSVPARCLLDPRWCRSSPGSVPAGAGSVLAQTSSTPNGSISIESQELGLHPRNASIPRPAASLKSHSAHHNDWMSFRRRSWIRSIESALSKVPHMQKQFRIRPFENENTIQ